MCGIFAYIEKKFNKTKVKSFFNTIKVRGPEHSELLTIGDINIGFHRLSINDISKNGNQPLFHPEDENIIVICNGEIYNFESLKNDKRFINILNTNIINRNSEIQFTSETLEWLIEVRSRLETEINNE